MLLFVDALMHGSARRVNPGQRRIAVYRYGPSWGYFRRAFRPSQALLARLTPQRRTMGVAFRRQVVIGEYIVDFGAMKERLVIEVDGACHEGRAQADARRDRALARAGWRVLRLPAELVMADVAAAATQILACLA